MKGPEQRPDQHQLGPDQPNNLSPEAGQPAPVFPEPLEEDSPEAARGFLTQFYERAEEFTTPYPRGTEEHTKARLARKEARRLGKLYPDVEAEVYGAYVERKYDVAWDAYKQKQLVQRQKER